MSVGSERKVVLLSALMLAGVGAIWVAGWAVREARDVDPTALALLERCLENERSLDVSTPAGDPLAASAPRGSLTTTVFGNSVSVSLWKDEPAAERTIATYARLTPEDLTTRAIARGRTVFFWAAPPTDEQAAPLYGCGA